MTHEPFSVSVERPENKNITTMTNICLSKEEKIAELKICE